MTQIKYKPNPTLSSNMAEIYSNLEGQELIDTIDALAKDCLRRLKEKGVTGMGLGGAREIVLRGRALLAERCGVVMYKEAQEKENTE